jgi:hypothetical protein
VKKDVLRIVAMAGIVACAYAGGSLESNGVSVPFCLSAMGFALFFFAHEILLTLRDR